MYYNICSNATTFRHRTHARSLPSDGGQILSLSLCHSIPHQRKNSYQFEALRGTNPAYALRAGALSPRWDHDFQLAVRVDYRRSHAGTAPAPHPAPSVAPRQQSDYRPPQRVQSPGAATPTRPLGGRAALRPAPPLGSGTQSPDTAGGLPGAVSPIHPLNIDPSRVRAEECTRHDHHCQLCRRTWHCLMPVCPNLSYQHVRCAYCRMAQGLVYDRLEDIREPERILDADADQHRPLG